MPSPAAPITLHLFFILAFLEGGGLLVAQVSHAARGASSPRKYGTPRIGYSGPAASLEGILSLISYAVFCLKKKKQAETAVRELRGLPAGGRTGSAAGGRPRRRRQRGVNSRLSSA